MAQSTLEPQGRPDSQGAVRTVREPATGAGRARRLLRLAGSLFGLAVFGLALWVLHDALRVYHYRELVAAFSALPAWALVASLALTAAGYLVLAGYDLLALRFIGRTMSLPGVATTAFIANALGNNFGNTLIAGAAVRYWIYTSRGLSAEQIARVVVLCSVGFWLGFFFLSGMFLTFDPTDLPVAVPLGGLSTRPLGIGVLLVLAGYLGVSAWGGTLRIGGRPIRLPSPLLTLGQIVVASLDLCLMAAAFYALVPAAANLTYTQCLAAFLVALVAGNVSLVPGGLGVFESVMIVLLASRVGTLELTTALLAFRGIYFILPLFVAVSLSAARGAALHVPRLRRLLAHGARWLTALAPQLLAAVTFVSGAILLFSGALPATAGRLTRLHEYLALPVIEASHFVASLAGAALLLLARGLQRRLDGAWLLAVVLLGTSSALSLAKGWDFEESILLGIACVVLLPFRRQFYRSSSLLGELFSNAWAAAIAIVLVGSAWLVLFAQTHEAYSDEPWWRFGLHAESSRSLRATVGAVALIALFALGRLLRPLRIEALAPSTADIERARPLVERSLLTYANLVFRGDKALLFSEAGDAFLMYGRKGRSWIGMGDPIGAEAGVRELLWRFRDLCDRYDGWCVFFEVHAKRREQYADLGLSLTPLGQEARVDLARFAIDTPTHKDLRQTRARLLRRGCAFEILPREAVPQALPGLAGISDAWLAEKATHEKGFSNASFDVDYLENFPVAVVRSEGRLVAFANLWLGAEHEELSVDLMRHLPDAPNGTMDFLFAELLLWGRAAGYRWFNFGTAPLSGLDTQPGAPVWKRVGTFLYRHGEHFYNFEGLRRFKAKFDPVWTPVYLASPGGLALAPVLVDVTAIIAGSVTGIVGKRGAARDRS
jgi:phosphatidylglycerol lysyltransferase